MDGAMATALGAALVAMIGGVVGVINSTRANRPAEMNAQLAWVKSAQDDAAEARSEAREAKAESSAARREADATYRQSVTLRRDFEAIQDWVDRVVRTCETYRRDMDEAGRTIDDSGVLRIIRVVNGGPHIDPR